MVLVLNPTTPLLNLHLTPVMATLCTVHFWFILIDCMVVLKRPMPCCINDVHQSILAYFLGLNFSPRSIVSGHVVRAVRF